MRYISDMPSTTHQIRHRIMEIPAGTPFSVKELLSMGPRPAIDQALSRMVRGGLIARVTRGVFVRPKENRYLGKLAPEPGSVAKLVATSSGGVLAVHGAEAARQLGLTTQVPAQPVFYTSGPGRRFRMGELQVVLKHVSPRRLSLAGRPAGTALSALWYLGKHQVTPEVVSTIKNRLGPEEFAALEAATTAMPGWMIAVLRHQHHEHQATRHG
jgi:hypothetical protein